MVVGSVSSVGLLGYLDIGLSTQIELVDTRGSEGLKVTRTRLRVPVLSKLDCGSNLRSLCICAEPNGPDYVAVVQLRDTPLDFKQQRMRRWNKVTVLVESNSNVRANVIETAEGDETRVWRWIGPYAGHTIEAARRRLSAAST